MKYGQVPKLISTIGIDCKEMMFYQDMLIKEKDSTLPLVEDRLNCFKSLLGTIACDYIADFGLDNYMDSYMYMSAKNLFQQKGSSFNRPGWHSDGFMSDDINYIWSDRNPTVFNISDFYLSKDHSLSILEMEKQALKFNNRIFNDNTLLRLNQYVIHKVGRVHIDSLRCFVKVSFSKDRYDLEGNSLNPLFHYDKNWKWRKRSMLRNTPQNN